MDYFNTCKNWNPEGLRNLLKTKQSGKWGARGLAGPMALKPGEFFYHPMAYSEEVWQVVQSTDSGEWVNQHES